MILESTQLLCTAVRVEQPEFANQYSLYRMAHMNHPCAKWVRLSDENYHWLLEHMFHLSEIYEKSYKKIHACTLHYPALRLAEELMPPGELSPFPNCTNDPRIGANYTDWEDVVAAYRTYLLQKWLHQFEAVRFRGRAFPSWLAAFPEASEIRWATGRSVSRMPQEKGDIQ